MVERWGGGGGGGGGCAGKRKELEDIQRRTRFNSTVTEICKSAQISKHHREEELEEGVKRGKESWF